MQHGSRSRNLQTQGYPERFFATFDCSRQGMKDEDRGSHIGRVLVCLFFVFVSNHYFSIVLFLVNLQHTHTSIKVAKIVTLKPFPSSTNFNPDLRLTLILLLLYNLSFCKLLYNLLENICHTKHESISC